MEPGSQPHWWLPELQDFLLLTQWFKQKESASILLDPTEVPEKSLIGLLWVMGTSLNQSLVLDRPSVLTGQEPPLDSVVGSAIFPKRKWCAVPRGEEMDARQMKQH